MSSSCLWGDSRLVFLSQSYIGKPESIYVPACTTVDLSPRVDLFRLIIKIMCSYVYTEFSITILGGFKLFKDVF